jgi:hypothetical protein
MKKLMFLSSAVLCLLQFSAKADIISGIVTDSATGKPLAHARVYTDSVHKVYTDSLGNFSFNTDGIVGIVSPQAQSSKQVTWEPNAGAFYLTGNSGAVSVQIRNMLGALVGKFSSGNLSADYRVSLTALPKGIYMASITVGGRTTVQKIMNMQGALLRAFEATYSNGNVGLAKLSAVKATTMLNFHKLAHYDASKTVTGPQTGLAVKLQENFTDSRYDFLWAGEWQGGEAAGTQKMYIVRGGKIEWTYTERMMCEFDDTWMRSDGSIVASERRGAREIKGEKDTSTVWYIAQNVDGAGPQGELHVMQPIGLDKYFIVVNRGQKGSDGYLIKYKTGDTLRHWAIPGNPVNTSAHMNFRHVRITRNGTMLCAHMDGVSNINNNWGRVVEYDTSNMKALWADSTNVGKNPWSAVLLKNGNILVGGNGDGWVREISRTHQLVMDIRVGGVAGVSSTGNIQEVSRLSNGNTIVSSNGGNPGIMEISQTGPTTGKLVWKLQNLNLGIGTDFQVLDPDEGVPENPGDLER